MNETTVAAGTGPRPSVLWVGDTDTAELALARGAIDEQAVVVEAATVEAACDAADGGPWPAVILLASPTPPCWSLADGVRVSRRWPLTPIVSVGGPLVEGRRRSGPPLPGIEEVSWCELPGRLAWWLHDRDCGRPGWLGMPTTARREERLAESAARVGDPATWRHDSPRITAVASRQEDLEPLTDLLAAAGQRIVRRGCGRPAVDEDADVVVWDCGAASRDHVAWLEMLSANRPGLAVILFESFPRGESMRAAHRAGAAAVLGRPASLEAVAGTLLLLRRRCGIGLGRRGTGD